MSKKSDESFSFLCPLNAPFALGPPAHPRGAKIEQGSGHLPVVVKTSCDSTTTIVGWTTACWRRRWHESPR